MVVREEGRKDSGDDVCNEARRGPLLGDDDLGVGVLVDDQKELRAPPLPAGVPALVDCPKKVGDSGCAPGDKISVLLPCPVAPDEPCTDADD